MIDLSAQFSMIESIFAEFGLDPVACRGEKPGQWALVRGSAKVWVDIWYIETEGRAYFQGMSPVMMLPAADQQAAFFKELLEINDQLFGVAFTVFNGWAWLKHIRETDGLDKAEATATINRIGVYADKYDDMLKAKYGESVPPSAGVPGAPGAA
jgi:hypothetical protein